MQIRRCVNLHTYRIPSTGARLKFDNMGACFGLLMFVSPLRVLDPQHNGGKPQIVYAGVETEDLIPWSSSATFEPTKKRSVLSGKSSGQGSAEGTPLEQMKGGNPGSTTSQSVVPTFKRFSAGVSGFGFKFPYGILTFWQLVHVRLRGRGSKCTTIPQTGFLMRVEGRFDTFLCNAGE